MYILISFPLYKDISFHSYTIVMMNVSSRYCTDCKSVTVQKCNRQLKSVTEFSNFAEL